MSQSGADKQKRIKDFLERLKNLVPDFPTGEIQIYEGTDKDPPDAVVAETGIEVIDYIRGARFSDSEQSKGGSEIRAVEEIYKTITDQAQRRFEQDYSILLWVSLHWNHHIRPMKNAKALLIDSIVSLVADYTPTETDAYISVEYEQFETDPLLSNYLHNVGIYRLEAEIPGLWYDAQAAFIGVSVDEIEALIRAKERDLPRYKNKFKSVWLLIVADSIHLSSHVWLSPVTRSHIWVSTFNRVYLLDIIRGEATLLVV